MDIINLIFAYFTYFVSILFVWIYDTILWHIMRAYILFHHSILIKFKQFADIFYNYSTFFNTRQKTFISFLMFKLTLRSYLSSLDSIIGNLPFQCFKARVRQNRQEIIVDNFRDMGWIIIRRIYYCRQLFFLVMSWK